MYIYFSNIMKKVYWTLKMIMVAFMLRENRCIREGKTITLTYFRCRRLGEELSWQALMAALRPWAELHSWACYRRLQWYDNTATWRCVHMTDSRLHPWERHRSVQHTAHIPWCRIDFLFSVKMLIYYFLLDSVLWCRPKTLTSPTAVAGSLS